jgi:hypothetical protein
MGDFSKTLDFRFFFAYARPGERGTAMSEKVENSENVENALSSMHATRSAAFRDAGRVPVHADDSARVALSTRSPKPWTLPAQGLALFHGAGDAARLSHYFLPRLLMEGKRVLYLDGANSADPRLLERLARQRGVRFEQFSRRIQIARAFTCFQLTELVARVPRFLADFPAEVLIVTAFPDLYFDEDIRDWDARVAFEQALADLRRWAIPRAPFSARADLPIKSGQVPVGAASRALAVAVFSSASTFSPSPARRRFFERVSAAAAEVWEFSLNEGHGVELLLTTARAPLPQGRKPLAMGSGDPHAARLPMKASGQVPPCPSSEG